MGDIGRVVALAPDEVAAHRTRAHLASSGIESEVRRTRTGRYRLEDETFREHVVATRRGILVGMFTGALVGLAVVLLVPAVRSWDLVFRLLLIAGIALQGTMPAIMWRFGRSDRTDDDPVRSLDLGPETWLVMVRDEHAAARAHHVVERDRLVFLDDEEPAAPRPNATS